MNSQRWQQVRLIFEGALDLQEDQRPGYLERVCTTDAELRHEVESLLLHHQQAGTAFLKTPAIDLTTGAGARTRRVGCRIGVYQIGEEIGRGGMGEVYRAARADGLYQKEVALKLVRTGFDSDFILDRFRNERQILATLDHPNIARLLDGGTAEDGVPYLVMELVEGVPIDQYCHANALPIPQRLQLFRQVCAAVQYAHQRLVIHRDLKPSNILVTKEGVPKLLDFGIAKILDPLAGGETTLARPMTPEYASPEQIRGESITTASDVYSLGVLLYRLLTSCSPYGTEELTAHALARIIVEVEPPRPSSIVSSEGAPSAPITSRASDTSPARLRRQLVGDLDNIVLTALRKEPERRYGSAEHFSEDIRRHLENLPITAARDSWRYRAGKFVRRHRIGIAATALVLIAMMGGVAATLREARIARVERVRAERRFNEVRKLANSLIFEINDSVQYLPGSSAANKLIVEKSLEYLDSLAQESSGDPSLQRELATAYLKVAQIQGYPFNQNLGDAHGAMQSFHKSLVTRETLMRADPGRMEDQLALASLYRFMGLTEWMALGATEDATRDLARAVAIAEGALKTDPNNLIAIQELAADYLRAGDIQSGSGTGTQGSGELELGLENHLKAVPLFQRVAEAAPSNPRKQYPLAVAEITVGENLIKVGEFQQALQHVEKGCQVLLPWSADLNNTLFRRGMDSCYSVAGEALLRQGRYTEATNSFRKELKTVEDLAAADPDDVDMQIRTALARADLGDALTRVGKFSEGWKLLLRAWNDTQKWMKGNVSAEKRDSRASIGMSLGAAAERSGQGARAIQFYSETLENYQALSASDPHNVAAMNAVAMTRIELAGLYLKAKDIPQAEQQYQEAMSFAEPRFSTFPQDRLALYPLANSYAGMGDVCLAKSHGGTPGSATYRLQAQNWYKKSLAVWDKLHTASTVSSNGFVSRDPQEVRQRLAQLK